MLTSKEIIQKIDHLKDEIDALAKLLPSEERKNYFDHQESHEILRLSQSMAKLGYYTWNLKTNKAFWSDELFHILGLDPQSKEISPKVFQSYVHKNDFKRQLIPFKQTLKTGVEYHQNFRIIAEDGKEKEISSNARIIKFDENNTPEVIIGTFLDITESKQREVELLEANKQKEQLLRELHHRTKNNLQVISSLLELQLTYIDDPVLAHIFSKTKNRIKAMGLVHKKLYKSGNLSSLNLKEYVLGLIELLTRSHSEILVKLKVSHDLVDVKIPIDKAIPCGIVLNEIIANAFKHAFEHNEKPTLHVSSRLINKSEVELTIGDNGKGFSEKINPQTPESFGLTVIREIVVHQLHGHISIKNDHGTWFSICFPLEFV